MPASPSRRSTARTPSSRSRSARTESPGARPAAGCLGAPAQAHPARSEPPRDRRARGARGHRSGSRAASGADVHPDHVARRGGHRACVRAAHERVRRKPVDLNAFCAAVSRSSGSGSARRRSPHRGGSRARHEGAPGAARRGRRAARSPARGAAARRARHRARGDVRVPGRRDRAGARARAARARRRAARPRAPRQRGRRHRAPVPPRRARIPIVVRERPARRGRRDRGDAPRRAGLPGQELGDAVGAVPRAAPGDRAQAAAGRRADAGRRGQPRSARAAADDLARQRHAARGAARIAPRDRHGRPRAPAARPRWSTISSTRRARGSAACCRLEIADVDLAAVVEQAVEDKRIAHPRRSIDLELPARRAGHVAGRRQADGAGRAKFCSATRSSTARPPPPCGCRWRARGSTPRWRSTTTARRSPTSCAGTCSSCSSARPRNATRSTASASALFIVAEIVRAHGGTIQVDSDDQHGTTFRVRPPTVPP